MSGASGAPAFRCNGETVSRTAFYAIACDPRRPVVVQACAGAGKTWMLVSRILRALLAGARPHEIMAITFTRKAAGEMRQRLFEWLQQFHGADRATCVAALRDRGLTEEEIAAQGPCDLPQALSNLYQMVLDAGTGLRISTFHSWFGELLRMAPLGQLRLWNLPTEYELVEDDQALRERFVREWRASLLQAPELLETYRALVAQIGAKSLDDALDGVFAKRSEFLMADAAGAVQRSVPDWQQHFADMAGHAAPEDWFWDDAANRDTLLQAVQALARSKTAAKQRDGGTLQQARAQRDWELARGLLLTDKLEPRKAYQNDPAFAPVCALQDAALRVVEAWRQHAGWQYQQRLGALGRDLLHKYAAYKRERGVVDMNDVETAALQLLDDSALSGWVQERLDARLRHVLIDEFQDTNPLQWQALHGWLSAYAGAGQAPSVFIVGDPKQSIYRFRRAEPQVFVAAQAFVREQLHGDVLSCDHTRRTAPGLLEVINQTMEQAQAQSGFGDFRLHTTERTQGGGVQRLPPVPRPPRAKKIRGEAADPAPWRDSLTTPYAEEEATLQQRQGEQAAAWIATEIASRRLQPKDLMVLARKRAALQPLRDALRLHGIAAHMGGDDSELIDVCEVQDLLALLDVLLWPGRDDALARVLRSPLFGLDEAALIQLALVQRHRVGSNWFELLSKAQLRTQDGRAIWEVLLIWQGWMQRWPVHDALQAIYDHGSVLARYAVTAPVAMRDAVLANLRELLHQALALQGGRFLTPYAWVRALKVAHVKAPPLAVTNAVQLLTVHGAKGLESDVVLLLDCQPQREQRIAGYRMVLDWPAQDAAPSRCVLLGKASEAAPSAHPALQRELAASQREELNALYVAVTRAKTRLVLSCIARDPDEPDVGAVPEPGTQPNWWQRLAPLAQALPAPVLPPACGPDNSAGVATAIAAPQTFRLPNLPPAPVQPAQGATQTIATHEPAPDTARVGQAMHRMLQWQRWDATAQAAAAREFALTPVQVQQAARLARTIRHGQGAWAWDAAWVDWQADEVELLHQGQLLRLDRLVHCAGSAPDGRAGWWVLDYKSAHAPHEDAGLQQQLQLYRAAVQALHPDEPVRAAFLAGDGGLIALSPQMPPNGG